jgi:hypothetical protein
MASWQTYKGLQVPDTPTGDAGIYLKSDLGALADRAPYNSSSDPAVNDDTGDGFIPGSQWLNTSSQVMWVCADNTSGAAKWRSLYKRVENALVLMPDAAIGGTDTRAIQLDTGGDARGSNAIDFQRTRSASTQVANGSNAALLGGENNTAFSADSVVLGGNGNNAGGSSGTITGISVGNPTTVTTSAAHGLVTGTQVAISGSNSTPSIDGNKIATVTGSNTFTVAVNVTSAGTTGAWTTGSLATSASVAGGEANKAIGFCSHVAGGSHNSASRKFAHAEGSYTVARGIASHAEGTFTTASGAYSHAEGSDTQATATASHAEGSLTTASFYAAHAEGVGSSATGPQSHAEGKGTIASGSTSHAEGYSTTASGYPSHAEGVATVADGVGSHAEGAYSTASGDYSHAGGIRSKTLLFSQWARASGGHSNALGTSQTTITQLFRRSTSGAPQELTLQGAAPGTFTRFFIRDGQTLSCFINIVGRKEDPGANDHASFMRQVLIQRESSTTALVGSVQTIGTDINPAGWGGVTITADDTNESLKIEVTGASATNIRWTATVIASEAADAAI